MGVTALREPAPPKGFVPFDTPPRDPARAAHFAPKADPAAQNTGPAKLRILPRCCWVLKRKIRRRVPGLRSGCGRPAGDHTVGDLVGWSGSQRRSVRVSTDFAPSELLCRVVIMGVSCGVPRLSLTTIAPKARRLLGYGRTFLRFSQSCRFGPGRETWADEVRPKARNVSRSAAGGAR